MITSQEAKSLYDKSGAEVQDYLTHNIEKEIIRRSQGGNRDYTLHLGAEQWSIPKLTPLLQGVMDELKRLGYRVKYTSYGEKYVPRGLADDDGNGPEKQNYGIEINW